MSKTPEELDREKRLKVLKMSFDQNMEKLTSYNVSKKAERDKETERLRAEARAAGKSEKEIRETKAKTAPGMYYDPTIAQYRHTKDRFCEWLVDKHPECNTVRYAQKMNFGAEWLKETYGAPGQNVGTLKTNRSQLTKYMGIKGTDLLEVKEKRPMPTKGRDFDPINSPIHDAKKYGDLIPAFGKITGARLDEIPHITPSCFKRHSDGRLYCHYEGQWQHTKGARDRQSKITKENEKQLLEILKGRDPLTPIIDKIPDGYNEQAYRRLAAADVYHEYAKPFSELAGKRVPIKAKRDYARGTVRTSAPAILHSTLRDKDFDRDALAKVAEFLGHGGDNRVDLVVKFYADYF